MENHFVFPAVGQCIYCGTTEPDGIRFGHEHIIPEGLAGLLVLKEASCRRCEAVINVFETRVLRETFAAARTHLNIRSKKRRLRPKTLPLGFGRPENGNFTWREIDLAAHPFTYFLPRFELPELLGGRPAPDGTYLASGITMYMEQGGLEKLAASGANGAYTPFRPDDIGRFVAKVSHAFAVARLGLGAFEPLLTDFIRGRGDHGARLVGCEDGRGDYQAGYHRLGLEKRDGLLIARLHLFDAIAEMPGYVAVVGRV